jgi:hypothetical protein
MSECSDELRRTLIHHVHEVTLERQQREPLYDTRCGGVSDVKAATWCSSRLGCGA